MSSPCRLERVLTCLFVSVEQVETLLIKTQDPAPVAAAPAAPAVPPMNMDANVSNHVPAPQMGATLGVPQPSIAINGEREMDHSWSPQPGAPLDDFNFNSAMGMGMNNVGTNFPWEMIGLGLEEPLPPQDTIDELYVFHLFAARAHFVSLPGLTLGIATKSSLKRCTHRYL